MAFKDGLVTFLQIFADNGNLALALKSGPNAAGVGKAVLQFFSGDPAEVRPAEITAAPGGGYPSMVMTSPDPTAFNRPATVTLRGGPLVGDTTPLTTKSPYVKVTADLVEFYGQGAAKTAVHVNGPLTVDPGAVTSPALGSGWSNFGAGGYADATVRQLSDGTVVLSGLIKGGTTGFANPVFTLPVGQRPTAHHIFVTGAGGGLADVRVFSGGVVAVYGYFAGGTNSSVSLDGISFLPAP